MLSISHFYRNMNIFTGILSSLIITFSYSQILESFWVIPTLSYLPCSMEELIVYSFTLFDSAVLKSYLFLFQMVLKLARRTPKQKTLFWFSWSSLSILCLFNFIYWRIFYLLSIVSPVQRILQSSKITSCDKFLKTFLFLSIPEFLS